MNKLIEKLWNGYIIAPSLMFGNFDKDQFAKAIEKACEAQRRACWRGYSTPIVFNWEEEITPRDVILNAQITEEDYE